MSSKHCAASARPGRVGKAVKTPSPLSLLIYVVLIGLLAGCRPVTATPAADSAAATEAAATEAAATEAAAQAPTSAAAAVPSITAVVIPTLADSTQQEVLEAEQAFNYAADFSHDTAAAEQYLGDEYTDANNWTKEIKLASIADYRYRGESAEYSNVTVTIDGDTATISFTLNGVGLVGISPTSWQAVCTNTWMKRDGQWQLVQEKCS